MDVLANPEYSGSRTIRVKRPNAQVIPSKGINIKAALTADLEKKEKISAV